MGNGNNKSQSVHDVTLESLEASINQIYIRKAFRSKKNYIALQLEDIFKAATLKDLTYRFNEAKYNLLNCGCFSNVVPKLDTSNSSNPSEYDVSFTVKEYGRILGSIVGSSEGSLKTGLSFPSLFGSGERLDLEYIMQNSSSGTFYGAYSTPLSRKVLCVTSLYRQIFEIPTAEYRERNHGGALEFNFQQFNSRVTQKLAWEFVWRELELTQLSKVPISHRQTMGHHLKSSLKHTLTYDSRDSPLFSTSGIYFRVMNEYAGLGGNSSFLKNESFLQILCPLISSWTLGSSVSFSHIHEISDVYVSDKVFLGGPLSVRGFRYRGIGLQDGVALGKKTAISGGLSLFHPLSFLSKDVSRICRFHFFVNAGNLIDTNLSHFFKDCRISSGLGLQINVAQLASLELNYVLPLSKQFEDVATPGFQFGLGIQFL